MVGMTVNIQQNAKILIVDDDLSNVLLLEQVLKRAGYNQLKGISNSLDVLPLYATFEPDLLLLDLHMPQLSGFTILEQLQQLIPPNSYFPILVLTADVTRQTKQRALRLGAKDYVTKPIDRIEVLLRIRNLLETRFLHLQLQQQNQLLEEKVMERTQELEDAKLELLERLALAAEYRDYETGQHTQRVGHTSALLAERLGLAAREVEFIRQAAPLHDVGKIGISDTILLKAGKLTKPEFEQIKTHTIIGSRILAGSRFPILQIGEQIALTHHERWDGSGYPNGLKGQEIPLVGRIVAVADVLDALTHERPYKRAWSLQEAIAEITRQRGKQFDPHVVDAFLELVWEGVIQER